VRTKWRRRCFPLHKTITELRKMDALFFDPVLFKEKRMVFLGFSFVMVSGEAREERVFYGFHCTN
jgi:hypothetical protein